MFFARHLRDLGCAAVLLGLFCGKTHAGIPFTDPAATRSVSGQFIVTGTAGSQLAASPAIATNAGLIRLEPALLAVSAERMRESLRRRLNPELRSLNLVTPPRGKIFLVLRPAQSTNETVTIVSRRGADGWNYQVRLPDVLPRIRFVRGMTGVLLLQSANHDDRTRSAEIPAWLTDGLSQDLLAAEWQENVLSSPARMVNGQPSSTLTTTSGLDPLSAARLVLRDHAALTVAQMGWPDEAQLSGADDGVYRANTQLFVNNLLELKGGPAHLRAMLETLPAIYNWQTAFQSAFRENFPRPLDVEKWWALQVVNFVARDPGPAWAPEVSREKLDEILSVPVEMRRASNALPAHAEISFQVVIRNFDHPRQLAILQPKWRDLERSELRLAAPFAGLADGYRQALADYFGGDTRARRVLRWIKHPLTSPARATENETLKKLDRLDAQRRAAASALKTTGRTR